MDVFVGISNYIIYIFIPVFKQCKCLICCSSHFTFKWIHVHFNLSRLAISFVFAMCSVYIFLLNIDFQGVSCG